MAWAGGGLGWGRERLVAGRSASLSGVSGWETFFEVTLESVRLHARRHGRLPRPAGEDGPYTSDALMHRMHVESPYDELDATSQIFKGNHKLRWKI